MLEKYTSRTRRQLACARMALNQISRLSLDPLPRSRRIGEGDQFFRAVQEITSEASLARVAQRRRWVLDCLLAARLWCDLSVLSALIPSSILLKGISHQAKGLSAFRTRVSDSGRGTSGSGGRAERHASVSSSHLPCPVTLLFWAT